MNAPALEPLVPAFNPGPVGSSAPAAQSKSPGGEEILSRIDLLLPKIRARREEIESSRKLPRDLVEELRKTGMFALNVPRALGGREACPLEAMRVVEKVSSADGSTGWCVMNAVACNAVAGYMNEAGAREIFSDPTRPLVGISAPAGRAVRVDGGIHVSGRWSFASGISHCEWVWAGCMIMEGGQPRMTPHGPEIVHVFLPVSEITIHDTWQVSGLCGTGSHDFSVTEVRVPERRIFALLDPAGHRSEPLYQMPPLPLYVFQLACVSLGIARGALDEFTELAKTKVPTMHQDVLAERPMAQVELARAETALGSARGFLHEMAMDMWESVRAGRQVSTRQIAISRAAATQAAETALAVTQVTNRLAGGGSIYATSALQRHARDAEAVTHHFTVAPHTWENAGRLLFGRKTIVPVF